VGHASIGSPQIESLVDRVRLLPAHPLHHQVGAEARRGDRDLASLSLRYRAQESRTRILDLPADLDESPRLLVTAHVLLLVGQELAEVRAMAIERRLLVTGLRPELLARELANCFVQG